MSEQESAYLIPFRTVWEAVHRTLATAPGWSVVEADGRAGEIVAEHRGRLRRTPARYAVRLRLDESGRTALRVNRLPEATSDQVSAGRAAAGLIRRLERDLSLPPRG